MNKILLFSVLFSFSMISKAELDNSIDFDKNSLEQNRIANLMVGGIQNSIVLKFLKSLEKDPMTLKVEASFRDESKVAQRFVLHVRIPIVEKLNDGSEKKCELFLVGNKFIFDKDVVRVRLGNDSADECKLVKTVQEKYENFYVDVNI